MKKSELFLVASFILVAAMKSANAQTTRNTMQSYNQPVSAANPEGFLPFIGLGAGYMDRSDRIETEGVPMNIKLLGSYYFRTAPWLAELGLGYQNQQFSQTGGKSAVNTGLVEVSGRYRFGNRWQFGPVVNAIVGESDRYNSNSDFTWFAGLGLDKEFALDQTNILRVGVSAMTDLNVQGERVNIAMLNVAWGFGNYRSMSTRHYDETRNDRGVEKAENTEFAFDSTNPNAQEQTYLRNLASELKQHPDLVKRIQVVGHADKVGSANYNMELSKQRAEKVADILSNAGLSDKVIATDWKGERQPLVKSDDISVLRQNRRVEIKFYGVKDKDQLDQVLKRIE